MSAHYQSAHYGASHYLSSHYGRTAIFVPPLEQVHPMGSDLARRKRILRDDDELVMALIMAFLETKD
jgi:hypothetical protein